MKTKKRVSLLVAGMLCMLLLANISVYAAVPNQLQHSNVGFEDGGFTGWYKKSTSEWTVTNEEDAEAAHDGSHYLKVMAAVETTENYDISYNSSISLSTTESYIYSAWVYVPKASSVPAATIGLRVDQTADKYAWVDSSVKGWQRLSVTFTPDMTEPKLRLFFKPGVAKDTILYFDDVTLEKVADVAAEEALRFASDTEYSMLPLSADNWTSTTATVSFPEDGIYAGTMKAEVPAAGTYDISLVDDIPSLTADKNYEASAWVYIPETSESAMDYIYISTEPQKGGGFKNTQLVRSTDGEWRRINVVFTASNTGKMNLVKFRVVTTGAATVYLDNISVVEKTVQEPVLQFTKATVDYKDRAITLGMLKPEAGAFTVKYDIHAANAAYTGNVLIAAIYKETNNIKQLVEVSADVFEAADTEISLAMQGVANPDASYSVKVMLWDDISGLQSLKRGEFTLN